MLPSCAEPRWLLLLLLLPLMWHAGRQSLAGLSRYRRFAALTLRLMLMALLIFALARPRGIHNADAVATYFVVDLSDSIPRAKIEEIERYLQAASETRPGRALCGLIYFGANAACEQPPAPLALPAERQSVVDTAATDIGQALRLAECTFPSHARRRIVLITDGNQNRGDALAEVERLRGEGVQVCALPIEYRHEREISVQKAVMPEEALPGSIQTIKAFVHSTQAADIWVEVRKGGMALSRRRVSLQPGKNRLELPVKIADTEGRGLAAYQVAVEPVAEADDQISTNNSAFAFTRLLATPAILYVDGNLETGDGYVSRLPETLLRGLRLFLPRSGGESPAITLKVCAPADMPSAEDLARFDAIVLDNVAADSLGGERMARIHSLVAGQGIGLFMIGGENSFGPGNYRQTPVEEALPVEMDLKNKKVIPNGALILVIDRSGSMEGEKLEQAKAAARAAVQVLSPTDYIGVIAFDAQPEWLVTPVLARDSRRISQQISRLTSAGGTDIPVALTEAYKAIKKLEATLKHIVILSDGQSPDEGINALLANMTQEKITVSSVGIGEPDGQSLMQHIAKRGGGRYHFVANMKKLPRIFIHESLTLKRSLIFEESFVPTIADRGDDFLQDISGALPPLHGYVATTAKAGAHVPLVSANENKDPILAHWRYGFGQTAAFTSDAKNRWGKDWLSWEGYGPFWTGAVHRILREPPANLRLSLAIEGQTGKIVGQAMDESGNPLSFLEIEAAVTSPDGSVARLRLRQTGVGVYEGEFPAEKAGRYEVAAASAAAANMPACFAYAGVARPFNVENESLEPDRYFLEQLASKGGGRILGGDPAQDALFSPEGLMLPPSRDERWALLLALAAIILPLDVFSRRVMVDYAELRRWLTMLILRLRRKPLPREARLARLFSAKQRAIAAAAPRDLAAMPAPTPEGEVTAVSSSAPRVEADKAHTGSATAYTGRLLQAKQRALSSQQGK